MITQPAQADQIVRSGQGDLVVIAREFLRNPYWPLHAADAVHQQIAWPVQYARAASRPPAARQPVSTPTE
jgi:2,4-dienoyl-CoA reductase-like NADH-dependent reductase (Old Yellow Enzyme family)